MSTSRKVLVVPGILLGLAFLLMAPMAQAAVYYWVTPAYDSNGVGVGVWDTDAGDANWTSDNVNLVPWQGAGDAEFPPDLNASAFNITVNNTQTVGNMTFDTGGYTLTGGALNLTGGNISVNGGPTVINSSIQGSAGLTLGGDGSSLTLSQINTYSSATIIQAGTLKFAPGPIVTQALVSANFAGPTGATYNGQTFTDNSGSGNTLSMNQWSGSPALVAGAPGGGNAVTFQGANMIVTPNLNPGGRQSPRGPTPCG